MRATLVLLLAAALAACSNSVDVFDEEGGFPFAVYGFLDAARDTQQVRVEPVQPRVPADTARIRARLDDLTAGVGGALAPRVVPLSDGTTALVYRRVLPVLAGHTYRLTVTAPDGAATIATATVPARRDAHFGAVESVRDERDDSLTYTVPLVLRGPQQVPAGVTLLYDIARGAGDSVAVAQPYGLGRVVGEGYAIPILLSRDRRNILDVLGLPAAARPTVLGVRVLVQDNGPEWDAGGNIENGAGLFSTVYRSTQRLVLPDAALRLAGFTPPADTLRRN